ncbi:MAG: bifunctional phosphoribosylaminoimidazolecarboxamide formyltransferase/IMP cyclohydrolase [SAR202 cluster bacterium]|nr:bifunctional phosphoribosylaminoimidazolecarboxamide formyltransferase/IMP cyclohydrolase [SAR202 cluster bacterium]|tara:strand:+ start:87 stop:1628 length:1542 start_codon:yes stop_codon:yes gene_type:complete
MNVLISVSDKSNLDKIARFLDNLNCNIISTGGTYNYLKNIKVKNLSKVSQITNSPEILDGRVKTLHPLIHGGILAKRNNKKHLDEINNISGLFIDMVIVNLYPFEETLLNSENTHEQIIEMIDIGGPTLIRAAAKNYESVAVLVNPNKYELITKITASTKKKNISIQDLCSIEERKILAAEAFEHVSKYDSIIHSYLNPDKGRSFPLDGKLIKKLRYGENPHQEANLYKSAKLGSGIINGIQIHGKEMSFNNIIDGNTAWQIVNDFNANSCVIVKHANPCGLASGSFQSDAFQKAFDGDQVSAYGGIVAFNNMVEENTVKKMKGIFFELIIAPDFSENALLRLQKRKDLRIISMKGTKYLNPEFELKTFAGGYIIQNTDIKEDLESDWEIVTKTKPGKHEFTDLKFAWKAIRHVKSNGIILVKNQSIIGLGTGQPNRINSIEIASKVAGGKSNNSVLASDAFFPFADNVQLADSIGVKSIIQPGGSIRDPEVIDLANKLNISMIFTGTRHFKH